MDIWESQTVLKISFLKVFINMTYKLGPQLVIVQRKFSERVSSGYRKGSSLLVP